MDATRDWEQYHGRVGGRLSSGVQWTMQPQRAVKSVMWSVTAGLHHCKAVLNTKGGLSRPPPADGAHAA